METKLTLRVDSSLIRRAKAYAQRRGKSVSAIVADYFLGLQAQADESAVLPPKVKSLLGALGGAGADGAQLTEDSYRRHLEKKHA